VGSIAGQLRGVYKPHQCGGVILPMTILRRLDCALERSRDLVRERCAAPNAILNTSDAISPAR
jgi:type I restriction enzyme M protein